MVDDIVIPDKKRLGELEDKISKQGVSKLHVLADFDRTLTKAFVDGKEVPSLISVLRDGNYLTQDYAQKANGLMHYLKNIIQLKLILAFP
ncbi:MAG: hypothetical protein AB1571_03120 [Nanoarchaeota archaeon]